MRMCQKTVSVLLFYLMGWVLYIGFKLLSLVIFNEITLFLQKHIKVTLQRRKLISDLYPDSPKLSAGYLMVLILQLYKCHVGLYIWLG